MAMLRSSFVNVVTNVKSILITINQGNDIRLVNWPKEIKVESQLETQSKLDSFFLQTTSNSLAGFAK